MLIKAVALVALATAGCQNASQLDRGPGDPYARPVENEPRVKVISVERLGDAPEHPTTAAEAQARRTETATRRRAQTSRFEARARDGARSEPTGTPAWPPGEVEAEVEGGEREGEGAGASAGPFSETSSGHGTTTNTGVNTENQGTGGTDDPRR